MNGGFARMLHALLLAQTERNRTNRTFQLKGETLAGGISLQGKAVTFQTTLRELGATRLSYRAPIFLSGPPYSLF